MGSKGSSEYVHLQKVWRKKRKGRKGQNTSGRSKLTNATNRALAKEGNENSNTGKAPGKERDRGLRIRCVSRTGVTIPRWGER